MPVALNIKDSANMFPSDWKAIAEFIYARRNDGYKGFNQTGVSQIILQTNPTISD